MSNKITQTDPKDMSPMNSFEHYNAQIEQTITKSRFGKNKPVLLLNNFRAVATEEIKKHTTSITFTNGTSDNNKNEMLYKWSIEEKDPSSKRPKYKKIKTIEKANILYARINLAHQFDNRIAGEDTSIVESAIFDLVSHPKLRF